MPQFALDSYPPVARFDERVGAAELRAAISRSNDDPIPRPLSLNLRMPGGRGAEFDGDMARLYREVDLVARLLDRDRNVVELRIETGTAAGPIALAAIRDVFQTMHAQFHFSPAATCELSIDLAAGAPEPALISDARSSGFHSVGVVTNGIQAALQCVFRLRPDRLMVQSETKRPRAIVTTPDGLAESLERAGYTHIGLQHFALAGDDLAVALNEGRLHYGPYGFTPHADCDVLGFGTGAICQIGGCLSQNKESLIAWRRAVDSGRLAAARGIRLSKDDELRGELIEQLLCRRMIAIADLEGTYGINFRRYFSVDLLRLAPCIAAGFIRDLGNRIEVCSRGWPWLQDIALCFDAYANADRCQPIALRRH